MHNKLVNFYTDETGAVTVDWVVLTAAVIGLGGAVMVSTGSGTMSLANLTSSALVDSIPSTLSAEEFIAEYVLIYASNDFEYGDGRTWLESNYATYSEQTDAELSVNYDELYAEAATGENRKYTDNVLIIKQVMDERGIEAPSGDLTSVEIRALYN